MSASGATAEPQLNSKATVDKIKESFMSKGLNDAGS